MPIFPPSGEQDQERRRRIKSEEEHAYLLFCLEFCDHILERRPGHPEAMAVAAQHFTSLGYFADGLALDRRLADIFPGDPGVIYNLSCSLALTGNREEALHQLDRAVDNGYHDCGNMLNDPDLAAIRPDPRFLEIFMRAALQAETGQTPETI
ncbi:MAG: hypothetical protein LBU64_01040 [Planctomycetota bacterium]|nr:hypothetical protein [Planctomycetota bacterium]